MGKVIQFLREVGAELRRVTWPTRESLIGGTIAVFVLSAFLTLYVWVVDIITSRVVAFFMR